MKPIMTDAHASTTAQGPAMETRPAKMPFSAGETSGVFLPSTCIANVVTPAEHADKVVATAARAACCMCEKARVDTGLKPYQPNHRIKVPRAARTVE